MFAVEREFQYWESERTLPHYSELNIQEPNMIGIDRPERAFDHTSGGMDEALDREFEQRLADMRNPDSGPFTHPIDRRWLAEGETIQRDDPCGKPSTFVVCAPLRSPP